MKYKLSIDLTESIARSDIDDLECVAHKINRDMAKPKVSEASQFHHPPHVPSCNAHQLPIQSAERFTMSADQLTLSCIAVKVEPMKGTKLPRKVCAYDIARAKRLTLT